MIQTKLNILQSKLKSLNVAIDKENKIRKKNQNIMPVGYNPQCDLSAQINLTQSAIEEATTELNEFYTELDNTGNDIAIGTDNKIWLKLEQTFQPIPNYLLWITLNRMKDDNIEAISRLNSFDQSSDERHLNDESTPIAVGSCKEFITKAQSKQIAIYLEQVAISRNLHRLTQEYVPHYHSFMQSIKTKMELNNNDYDDRTIFEYITQYNAVSFNEGQHEFVVKELNTKQDEYLRQSKQLEGHTLMIQNLKELYTETDQLYSRTRNEIMSLYLVKGKLQHLESCMKKLIDETRQQLQNQQNNVAAGGKSAPTPVVTNTSMSINSFDSSGDNVLCSTKLDDNSMMR